MFKLQTGDRVLVPGQLDCSKGDYNILRSFWDPILQEEISEIIASFEPRSYNLTSDSLRKVERYV